MRSKFSGDTVYLIEPHDDEDAGSSPAADPENPDTANPSKMNSLENPNFPAAAKGGGNKKAAPKPASSITASTSNITDQQQQQVLPASTTSSMKRHHVTNNDTRKAKMDAVLLELQAEESRRPPVSAQDRGRGFVPEKKGSFVEAGEEHLTTNSE